MGRSERALFDYLLESMVGRAQGHAKCIYSGVHRISVYDLCPEAETRTQLNPDRVPTIHQ